jgi:hypothetical protein
MERITYPSFCDEYAKTRFPERVTNMDLVKRGKVFEMVVVRGDKCIYTPNFIVVTEVDADAKELRSQIKGFTFHDTNCQHISNGISGHDFSDFGIGSNKDINQDFLLETNFPDIPEDVLITIENNLTEVGALKNKYETQKFKLLTAFRFLYINNLQVD